jgi:hypothetical protein
LRRSTTTTFGPVKTGSWQSVGTILPATNHSWLIRDDRQPRPIGWPDATSTEYLRTPLGTFQGCGTLRSS